MTEELEKEAEVFATYYESLFPNEFETFYKAFLKVAEPREKRIEELETQIEKMKGCFNCKYQNKFVESKCGECEDYYSKWEIKENV